MFKTGLLLLPTPNDPWARCTAYRDAAEKKRLAIVRQI
jgi:hypothetical protein